MRKCMIRKYAVIDCKVKWDNGKYAVCETLNKRVDADGNAYGHGFKVYEVCLMEDGAVGTMVDCFDTMREAIEYAGVN